MQSLPPELKEEILLYLSNRELRSICSSSSSEFYFLCSSSSFWREKFREEGLPLLEEGETFSQWMKIYKRSLRASKEANNLFTTFTRAKGDGFLYSFSTGNLSSLEPLYWLGLNADIPSWKEARKFQRMLKVLPTLPEEEAVREKQRLYQTRRRFSTVSICKKRGEYEIKYSYYSGVEIVLVSAQSLQEFLYRYFYYKDN